LSITLWKAGSGGVNVIEDNSSVNWMLQRALQSGVLAGIAAVALLAVTCTHESPGRILVGKAEYEAYCQQVESLRKGKWESLSTDLFFEFVTGYCNLFNTGRVKNRSRAVVIDYAMKSTEPRLFILDLTHGGHLTKSLVAHGRNSGKDKPTRFSNRRDSKMSSLGFFATAEAYTGKHGYSLRLDGLEKDLNSNARKRDIVIHGADYVSNEFAKKHGRLGRSWGCPALPNDNVKEIIDMIKGGLCLYVHGRQSHNAQSSAIRVVNSGTIESFKEVFGSSNKSGPQE
jgi:hypothetical protein